ncbi:Protease inhibitor epi11 [Globisporangium polare]
MPSRVSMKTLVATVVVIVALAASNGGGLASAAKCDQVCENHGSPICGSDGITYLNACHFDRAYCEDKSLIPMGYGPCERH